MNRQSIEGQELGDRILEVTAQKVQAAQLSKLYQFKTYTFSQNETNLDLANRTPDAPNDGDNLFDNFKRAHRVFIQSTVDITVRFNKITNDAIKVEVLKGGQIIEDHVEVEKIFITGVNGAVIDVSIS